MHANDTLASTALQEYLGRMDAALARLSESDRREILLETQSHVADQAERSPMLSVPEILAELGEPEAYARTFVVGPERAARRRSGVLEGLAWLATGSWVRLPLLVFVLCCYSVAVFMAFMAIMEILEPANTGLVVRWGPPTERTVGFTASDPTLASKGGDVLGWWLVPIALSIAGGIHLAMSALLRRVTLRASVADERASSRA